MTHVLINKSTKISFDCLLFSVHHKPSELPTGTGAGHRAGYRGDGMAASIWWLDAILAETPLVKLPNDSKQAYVISLKMTSSFITLYNVGYNIITTFIMDL